MTLQRTSQLTFSVALAAVFSLWIGHAQVSHASVADGYKVPSVTIPYAAHKPTLDGVIHDDEWQGAACMTGLETTDKHMSGRQAKFYMMWDEDNLYIAMRSPLRPGERVVQALRDTTKDVTAVFDDSYEIWLDVGTQEAVGQPVYFQYLGNYPGARTDIMFEPASGNSRPGWTAGWTPKNSLVNNGNAKEWDMEVAVPWKSLNMTAAFHDGMTFSGLLTRDYKRPWDQVSFGGAGSYSVPDTYTQFTLSKTAPAVQMLAVADPAAQTFGLDLAASGSRDQDLTWKYVSDGGITKQGTLSLHGGQVATTSPMLALDKPGQGSYRITVMSSDGTTTYLDWSAPMQFADLAPLTQPMNDTGDQVALSLQLNPAHDFIRVTGDLVDYDNRAAIKRYLLTVHNSSGKTIASKELHLDKLAYVRDVVTLPSLAPGDYVADLNTFDAAGKPVFSRETKFTKQDPAKAFPWWNTTIGNINKVIAPWTPVTYSAGRFGVWDREMQVGTAGLPMQVTTRGAPLLANGGGALVAQLADGSSIKATSSEPKTLSKTSYRTVVESDGKLGSMGVSSVITVEFDGMYKVDMTLTPRGPTSVKSLQVVLPLRSSVATYLHACGEGIRYGYNYKFLPGDKTGQLWNSQAIDGQPMLVGSFIPYVWLGNPKGGICWFADGDKGWVPNNTTPAIEVRRDSPNSTSLVLNLISSNFTIDKPRKITFAFEATPTKPLVPGWRMNTWWTGDSFQDWAQVESEGHAGSEGLIFASLPFPLDPAKSKEMVDARHAQDTSSQMGIHKYRANAVPYFEHINMGEQFVPALTYFDDDWRTHVTRGLAYGKTLQDFMVYSINHWIQSSGIDGFYIDNVSPLADDNLPAGRGYTLPDGRIQPTYQMFDTRVYLLRMRAAMAEQGKSGNFVLHITHHMIAPWIESADVALDGEDHVIYPEMAKDFMDFWTLERLRLDYPEEWGTPVTFLQEYQGSWDHPAIMKVMRAYTGMMLLDDTLASANPNGNNQSLWIARDQFGIEAANVHFLPYWDTHSGMQTDAKSVYLTGWVKSSDAGGSNKLLMAVVNMGSDVNAAVHVDAAALHLPPLSKCRIVDSETLKPISVDTNGILSVPVPRHDYCQVLIEPLGSTAQAASAR